MNDNNVTKNLQRAALTLQLFAFILLLALLAVPVQAQTNATPQGTFFESVQGYFTSFNTNLDSTFANEHGEFWTGADSIQGGNTPLANSLGISYRLYKDLTVESVTRNSGVAGTLVSEQLGLGLNFIVHDAKLTLYADAGYEFAGEYRRTSDRIYGEVGVRATKALTEHTFAGIGIGGQFPANRQVFQIFGGFTF